MSRQYDDCFCDVPYEEMLLEDYVEDSFGIMYRRIGNTYYFVSSDGYIISMMKEKPRILESWPTKHGHRVVRIHGIDYYVHRLVAEAFIPNPHNYPVVRHLNDIPDDNDYRNLAWGTQSDNIEDCRKNGNMYMKKVYCFEKDEIYDSCADAARELGVHKSVVTLCCQGKNGTGNGYHFCYLDEIEEKRKDPSWLRVRILKPIVAISPEGERIRFNSRKEAGEALGIPSCGISSVINGHLSHTHGWRFEEG